MKFQSLALLLLASFFLLSCNKNQQPEPSRTGKTYVIISDLHLGDSRSISEGYGWNKQVKDTLSIFLDYLADDKTWDELIVAGDLFEEWTSPADVASFRGKNGNPVSEAEFFQKLVADNQVIFDKFRALKNSGRKLVYIPGNHDMLTTNSDFDACLSGIFEQERTDGVDGMGEYRPDKNIYVEHGHRYDILNAPYKGKCGVDGIPESSILPPGFFECKIYTSSKIEQTKGHMIDPPTLDDVAYDVLWNALGKLFGERDVVTELDGMSKTYKFDEYAGSGCVLFNKIDDSSCKNDGWASRCERNKAFMVPSITTSILAGFIYDNCDKMGLDILESGASGARILVWGHSHSPKLLSSTYEGKKVIYLNTGCWVDSAEAGAENTCTFGKITASDDSSYKVSLCRFDITGDGARTIKLLGTETLFE